MNFKHALCDIRVQEMLKQVPRIIKKLKNDLLPSLSFEQKKKNNNKESGIRS